ncbi:ATP-binding protein [Klenkia marina]|uniref:ATP-binding protein n=1 Tax=Klenkia marina TaxID=1960309 RepID=UPI001FB561A6|nr:ATP-binding protein [Klenkia marina]
MTTTAPPAGPAVGTSRPPLLRVREGRVLGGVAAGTADHLRLDPVLVRIAFVLLAVAGVGVVGYALLWFSMRSAPEGHVRPGTASAPTRRHVVGLVLLGLVALVLSSQLDTLARSDVVVPLVLAGGGLAVIWYQLDTGRTDARSARWGLVIGVLLAGGGLFLLLATTGQLANARNGFVATLVVLIGIGLATAPVWRRLLDSRSAERAARIRSEERAAVAAHLHDSVLQTLALVQKHAGDPVQVTRLARGQERELRSWLYSPRAGASGTWAATVEAIVAEVEADHEVAVDPVVVGDLPVDEAVEALGRATREAVVNAAKHAGVTTVDLYTEVTADAVTVFVRDRGTGFDPATVPADRRGLRDSVVGRLARVGGTADVHSAPGSGTEVELVLPRRTT